jgi:hypothetical protein
VTQKCSGTLSEEEWKEIVYYMYEEDDARYLHSKIVEQSKKKYNNKTIEQK